MHTSCTTARRLLLTPAAAACLVALAGCAGPRTSPVKPEPGAQAGPELPAPVTSLAEAGLREARHPSTVAAASPPPAGLDPTALMPVAGDAVRAKARLNDVLAEFDKPVDPPAVVEVDAIKRASALSHYVQGRQMLLAGEAMRAAVELKTATELDPTAGEPWRELGEAQLAQGLTGEATTSFRASAATGLREARTMELLGRAALERGDRAEATRFLAAALKADPDKADPALSRLILVELSRALGPQGYIIAAKEAIERALTTPTQLSASTRYSAELGAIFRRQGELWRDVGDAMCRLGNFPEAVAAYERSADLPTMDGKPILPRIVFAWMRAGRPSSAAAAVLKETAAGHGSISQSEIALLRHIATHGGDAQRIAAALDSLKSVRSGANYPSLERGLALAQAAILPTDAAIPVLRRHLEGHPNDVRAAVQLMDALTGPEDATEEALKLVSRAPTSAKAAAEALLQSRFSVEAILASMQGRTGDASSLLTSYFIAKQGRMEESKQAADRIAGDSAFGLVALNLRLEIAAELGDPDGMRAALGQLKASSSPLARRLLAHGLVISQRYREAAEVLRPLVNNGASPPAMEDLVAAGDLAIRLGLADEAEQWIGRAVQLDPYDDEPASLLLVLHSAGGPRPDNAKLTRVVRDLRQDSPDSRTLRLVRARDAMRRSQWAMSEAELRRLCEEDPGDAAPFELLGAVWAERFKVEPASGEAARTWLGPLLNRRPQSPVLLSAATTLEVARGHAADAVAPLKEALAAGGGPGVSRVLERVLREPLGKMTEADALTLARLQGRALTLPGSIEAAEFRLRTGHPEEALGVLSEALTADVDLSRDQLNGLLQLVARCVSEVKDPKNSVAMSAAASLFDRLIAQHGELSVDMHQRRLEAMTSSLDQSVENLVRAAKLCVTQNPSLQARPFVMVSQRLRVLLGRGAVAKEFMAKAVTVAAGDADFFEEWYLVVATSGTAADAEPMIEAANTSGRLRTVLDRIAQIAQVSSYDPDAKELRAEAAYILGTIYAGARKAVQSDAAYELALKYDPKHAWACNDLGYALADRGTDLEKASRLLEQAFKQKPNEASIQDSLGWLRYKQGIILDEMDPQTGLLKRRGALSLLEAAARMPRGQQDFTILDHVGDARWLAGRKNEAVLAWGAAGALCESMLKQVDQLNRIRPQGADAADEQAAADDSAGLAEARKLDASTKAKISAATKGATVHVAPQIANPDPQPAAAADGPPPPPPAPVPPAPKNAIN